MQRRGAIKTLGRLALLPQVAFGKQVSDLDKPVLRVAHITDVHLKNDLDAPAKFTRCLHHLQNLNPKVNMILNGGDVVFDMNKENMGTINAQWQLWHSTIKNECSLPVHYAIGNHDIWWSEDSKGDAFYGKKYSLGQLQMAGAYYSFTRAGWKFIVLDSVHLDIDGTWYIGKLGDAQMAWLTQELEGNTAGLPVCILSHIPILTATLMVQDDVVNKWEFLGGDMHTDVAKIINLFNKHPQVKLCLSGHIHIRDKVVYNQQTYICNGAVSGAWWEGNRRETVPGYGLLSLYADGRFEEEYVGYL